MTMEGQIKALSRRIALDQVEQDIKNHEEFALKSEVSSGDARAVAVQQLIGFYNGCTDGTLDYRDYLTLSEDQVATAWYDFGTAYLGG